MAKDIVARGLALEAQGNIDTITEDIGTIQENIEGIGDDISAINETIEGLESGGAPYIGENNNWFVWDIETNVYIDSEVKAVGQKGADGSTGNDGITPHIDSTTKHWFIGEEDTGIVAEGKDGNDGSDGEDGITPHIDPDTKHWFIGEEDTGIVAEGKDGNDGETGSTGETGATGANGEDGITPNIIVGNTTTLSAGSSATVTRREESPDAAPIFDFGIPKGADGSGDGDMLKEDYDDNDDGVVNDSDKLGGQLPEYYATQDDLDLLATIEYVDEEVGKVKTNVATANITSTWTGSDAPYTQNITVNGITEDTKEIRVSLPPEATLSQIEEYQLLNLQDGGQGEDYITLKAVGTKNTNTIPINITYKEV